MIDPGLILEGLRVFGPITIDFFKEINRHKETCSSQYSEFVYEKYEKTLLDNMIDMETYADTIPKTLNIMNDCINDSSKSIGSILESFRKIHVNFARFINKLWTAVDYQIYSNEVFESNKKLLFDNYGIDIECVNSDTDANLAIFIATTIRRVEYQKFIDQYGSDIFELLQYMPYHEGVCILKTSGINQFLAWIAVFNVKYIEGRLPKSILNMLKIVCLGEFYVLDTYDFNIQNPIPIIDISDNNDGENILLNRGLSFNTLLSYDINSSIFENMIVKQIRTQDSTYSICELISSNIN